MFKKIYRSFNSRIRVGNGQIIKVKGKGDVQVSTPASTKVITYVFSLPDIGQNLISVGQLVEKNNFIIFEKNKCVVSDLTSHELMLVKITYSGSNDDVDLWHKRLGHVNYISLNMLYKHAWLRTCLKLMSKLQCAKYVSLESKKYFHSLSTRHGELLRNYI
ncbi:pleiotropic drug resistance protein 3-like [Gossypium australe]|uniref:Pleiotropic drug resistance protein 3-like n=1 Tax=Gossypium australe TaxID=47621 RepID=A0A5B6WZG3_9ROSI|nr:pleiotropic drug resistance protein 3-like [Gossypium australe]